MMMPVQVTYGVAFDPAATAHPATKRNRDETKNKFTTTSGPQPKTARTLKRPSLPQQWDGGAGSGNANQLLEKYLGLARDAQAAGDRIAAENYSQHAEHYFRIINANAEGYSRSTHHQQLEETAQPHSTAAPTSPRPLTNGSGDLLRDIDLADENETEPGVAPNGLD